jgi:hypothetical protein
MKHNKEQKADSGFISKGIAKPLVIGSARALKTPTQNVIKTLTGKKVLFLENDNGLENGLDEFERILQSANIEYTILFELSEKPLDEIIKAINEHDAIVFMTQWVYEIAKKLFAYIKALPQKKIVIEVYISEPTWYYKSQHGSKHDVYIYSCQCYWGEADKDTETFYKLTNKAYWDYENGFNK